MTAVVGVPLAIASGVRAAQDAAMREHPGDRVAALVSYVDSPSHALSQRNRAVWALGQLGDARAMAVLQKYFTGRRCEHARLLCQHELAKAIRLCRGGTNVPAVLWRHSLL
jgi:hypothetical protein